MVFLQLAGLEVKMVRVTGSLGIKTGYVRIKPNIQKHGIIPSFSQSHARSYSWGLTEAEYQELMLY